MKKKSGKKRKPEREPQPEIQKETSRIHVRPLVHILLIIVIGFIAYSNTFHVPFQWDDLYYIEKNHIVKDFKYFLEPVKAETLKYYDHFKRRYITYLTFAINYKLHGLDVTGYHIINLSIHTFNTLTLYFLVLLIYKTPFFENSDLKPHSKHIAFFSALLFVSHPLQTEAVTYIYQRLASLVTFFYLLSLTAYVQSRLSSTSFNRRIFYALSLFSAVLAMKTKENAFTLPVVITLFEFSFFNGSIRRRNFGLVPMFLTMLIIPITLLDFDKPLAMVIDTATRGSEQQINRIDFFITQFRVIVTYIRLLFFPVNQTILYSFPLSHSFLEIKVILSFLMLLVIFSSAVCLFKHSNDVSPDIRLIALGIFWFFITISIESGVIPLNMVIQEYRMYLPSVGVFVAFTTGFFLLFNRIKDNKIQAVLLSILIILPLILSVITYSRNIKWKDSVTLWEDVVRKAPNRARGYIRLGTIYLSWNLLDKAIEYLEIGLKLHPNNAEVRNCLGYAYRSKGLYDRAIEYLMSAIRLNPDMVEAHFNLASAYQSKGLHDKAIEYYKNALRLAPEVAEAHYGLAFSYYFKGDDNKAIEHLLIATRLKPDMFKAHYQLAAAYQSKGLHDKAIEYFKNAIRLKPDMAELHHELGMVYKSKGLTEKAEEEFRTALKLNPALKDMTKNPKNSSAGE
ncbi:MAG: tetratricopeptide repeat protein [Nitrospirota bacterium]